MRQHQEPPEDTVHDRIAGLLEACARWSELGRHRKILEAVERALPSTGDRPGLRAALLIWKAHALSAMNMSDRASTVAAEAWDLEPSSQAAHIMALALLHEGEDDHAEQVLRFGLQQFPNAAHLVFQLVLLMAEQGRIPEAMDLLDEAQLDTLDERASALSVGIRANLLARMGRWKEAMRTIQAGVAVHPGSAEIRETYAMLKRQRQLHDAQQRLATSWQRSLSFVRGRPACGVDTAIEALGTGMDLPLLVILAARRLWRRFLDTDAAQPRSYRAWAAAILAAIFAIDGGTAPLTFFARYAGTSYETVRLAYRRIEAFLDTLDPDEIAASFAVRRNPKLDPENLTAPGTPEPGGGRLIPFPPRRGGKRS